ncbi:hypothetical protein GLW08_14545 [Pontibacillus yanchengensis]|uniref:Uncharacterized protein n=2 Tax=Pontibacillus yanchengensis TaxID=462910 RepID=A0ACC7VIE1_9BACI|nr:hypothetical protein [Pontibacillus yanchengensis]MYL35731.1 hypothetical protein [Pontibacillus yanchengensis]MYL54552.1 hypothetical protein [Pontibacillus yanchengensis]
MLYVKSIAYLVGMNICFIGAALMVKANIGTGTWTAFFAGLEHQFGLTIGFWYGFTQFILIFVNALLFKRKPSLSPILPLVLEAVLFDFWLEIVFHSFTMDGQLFIEKVVLFVIGLGLTSFGVATYMTVGYPNAPRDDLFLAISERFHKSIRFAQTSISFVATSSALLLGGPVFIGTFISLCFYGQLIQLWTTLSFKTWRKLSHRLA